MNIEKVLLDDKGNDCQCAGINSTGICVRVDMWYKIFMDVVEIHFPTGQQQRKKQSNLYCDTVSRLISIIERPAL